MSDMDEVIALATVVAAQATYEGQYPGRSWDDLPPDRRHDVIEAVTPAVTAAGEMIWLEAYAKGSADGMRGD